MIEFKEEQRFRQNWLWIILLGAAIMPIVRIYIQLIEGEGLRNNYSTDMGLIIFAISIFMLIVLFWIVRLKTEIDQNEIRMSYFPFMKKRVSWKEVKNAKVLNYGFVGGWGIRVWTKYGTVYNTMGNKGLAIQLTNGKKFLIGTQKESELRKVVEAAMKQKD
jgi:hypothetical protein